MNASIINFLNDGTIHPTRASHRTAAKAYHVYLLDQKNSSSNTILQFTPTQADALTKWDPNPIFSFDQKKNPLYRKIFFFFGDIFFFSILFIFN